MCRRTAASKFPSSDPRRGSLLKIIWTVQGWGAPKTMDMEGYVAGHKNFYSNVEELKNVAKTVGVNFTILEVQGLEYLALSFGAPCSSFKMIADHVSQQGEKLDNLEIFCIGRSPFLNETFLSLQRMIKKWKVKEAVVFVDVDHYPGRSLKLDDLAATYSLGNGHIGCLYVNWFNREPVSLTALKRVWEISDEMYINDYANETLFKGGRTEDRESAWQPVLDYFLHADANTID